MGCRYEDILLAAASQEEQDDVNDQLDRNFGGRDYEVLLRRSPQWPPTCDILAHQATSS